MMPISSPYDAGFDAGYDGRPRRSPYMPNSIEYVAWLDGYDDGVAEAEEAEDDDFHITREGRFGQRAGYHLGKR